MKLIIDIDDDYYEIVKHDKFMTKEEIESMDGIIENAPTINAIPIPKDATNGDMLKTVFPNVNFDYRIWWDNLYFKDTDWFYEPYEQEEGDE